MRNKHNRRCTHHNYWYLSADNSIPSDSCLHDHLQVMEMVREVVTMQAMESAANDVKLSVLHVLMCMDYGLSRLEGGAGETGELWRRVRDLLKEFIDEGVSGDRLRVFESAVRDTAMEMSEKMMGAADGEGVGDNGVERQIH